MIWSYMTMLGILEVVFLALCGGIELVRSSARGK